MRALLFALLLAPLALVGCDSSAAGGEACEAAGLTATGSFTATAAGDGFSAACVSGQFTNGVLTVAGIENITGGTGASQRQINLTVAGAAVGTVQVSASGGGLATYADVDLANPTAGTYTGISGEISVEAVSATGARGSFTFTARNNGGTQVQVTGGAFDITF